MTDTTSSAMPSASHAGELPQGVWNPLELIYGVLFTPRATFKHIALLDEAALLSQLFWAVLVYGLTAVVTAGAVNLWRGADASVWGLLWSGTWALIGSMIALGVVAGVVTLASVAFTGQHAFRRLAISLALATTPWLLYAPLAFFKVSIPAFGPLIAVFIGMALWGWNVALFGLGLSAVFNLSYSRTVLLMFLPIAMMWWFYLAFGTFIGMFFRLLP